MTTSDIAVEEVEEIRASLEAISLVRLASAVFEAHGVRFPAIRPAEVPVGTPMFSIALDAGLRWVGGTFIADRFAGEIVRRMGEAVTATPDLWARLVAATDSTGVVTRLWINSRHADAAALPPAPWRTAEIECRVRTGHLGRIDRDVDAWTRAIGACLSLVLSALGLEEINDFPLGLPEGAETKVLTSRYERNPTNRLTSINFYGYTCWACGFDYENAYGELGRSFIIVHHILPVSQMPPGYAVDPIREMVPLCGTCHDIAHRTNPPVHPVVLRELRGMPPRASIFLHRPSHAGEQT